MYDIQNAVKLNPKNTKNIKRMAAIHIVLGKLGEAEMDLQKCVNLEPRDPSHQAELNKVKAHIKDLDQLHEAQSKQDLQKCEELCAKILKDCTEFTAVKIQYIETLLQNVKITEALKFLTTKLSDEEKLMDEFEYLFCLAYYYDGKYEKAKKLLSNLLQKTKDNEKYNHLFKVLREIEKQKERANQVFKSGKYEEAIDLYTKLLELDPHNKNFNSTILSNRALCYMKLNKNMEALKDINKSIQLNENYMKAYARRGQIYVSLKMYDEARFDFQKVKEAEPNNKDVIKYLEECKKKEKEAKKRDYYKILDIKRDAKENDIRKAYKKLALKWHPDRNAESEESKKLAEKTFRDINDAYSVLSDPEKKKQYDMGTDPLNPEEPNMGGGDFSNAGGFSSGGFPGGFSSSGGFPGGFSSSGGPGGSRMTFTSSGGNPEEIFRMFFGGGQGENCKIKLNNF
jgi:DnaJ family protein C protein 7